MTYSYSYGDEPLERAFSSSGTEFELVSDSIAIYWTSVPFVLLLALALLNAWALLRARTDGDVDHAHDRAMEPLNLASGERIACSLRMDTRLEEHLVRYPIPNAGDERRLVEEKRLHGFARLCERCRGDSHADRFQEWIGGECAPGLLIDGLCSQPEPAQATRVAKRQPCPIRKDELQLSEPWRPLVVMHFELLVRGSIYALHHECTGHAKMREEVWWR